MFNFPLISEIMFWPRVNICNVQFVSYTDLLEHVPDLRTFILITKSTYLKYLFKTLYA